MRTKVRDWLSVTSTRLPDPYCTDIINDVCRQIAQNYDLRFHEVVDVSFNTVVGTRSYAENADFSRPLDVRLREQTDATKWSTLNQLSYGDFVAKYGGSSGSASSQGDPVDYAIFAGAGTTILFLGPTPGRVVTIEQDYYTIPADLVADGDSNKLTTNAAQLVLYKALALASKFMLEDDRAAVFEEEYQREMRNLLTEHSRARWSGKAVPRLMEPM